MFPIPFNFPFIKKDGSRTTIGDAINAGGGGSQYTLPTASANTKGGVKIGTGLSMNGEVLNVTGGSGGTVDKVHMRYIVENDDDFEYFAILERDYVGPGRVGYEIETESTSSSAAKINIYSVVYDETIKYKTLLKELTHNDTNSYSDGTISVNYVNTSWQVTFTDTLENIEGTDYTSPLTWQYDSTVDYVMLHPNN